jgi:hypothetical protein
MAETLVHDGRYEVNFNGIKLYKPVLRLDNKASSKAPDWIVEIKGDLTKGNLEGFETFTELFDFHFEYSRETSGHVGNEMVTSAGIQHSDVSLLIPAGTFSAKIRQALNNGQNIVSIKIHRLGNITDLKKPLQTLEFQNCLLTKGMQSRDFLVVGFRFIKIIETNIEFSQMDESQSGQNVCEVDYAKLKTV